MSSEANKSHAIAFMHDFARGAALDLNDFTDDATWWTFSTGALPIAVHAERTTQLAGALFAGPGRFEIEATTAEGDRVAVEATGHQPLTNGKSYDNTYLWLIRFRGGKIASVKAYFDTKLAQETFFRPG